MLSEDAGGGAAAGPSGNSTKPSNTAGPGGSGGGDPGYGDKVANMIEQRMLIDQNMKGKSCVVKIRLAPDGLVLSATAGSGDPAICRAGITAVNMIGTFPAPPSDAERTINATIQPQ